MVCKNGVVDCINYVLPAPNGEIDLVAGRGGGNFTAMPIDVEMRQVFLFRSPVKVFMLNEIVKKEDRVTYFIDISDDFSWGEIVGCIDEIVELGGIYVFKN